MDTLNKCSGFWTHSISVSLSPCLHQTKATPTCQNSTALVWSAQRRLIRALSPRRQWSQAGSVRLWCAVTWAALSGEPEHNPWTFDVSCCWWREDRRRFCRGCCWGVFLSELSDILHFASAPSLVMTSWDTTGPSEWRHCRPPSFEHPVNSRLAKYLSVEMCPFALGPASLSNLRTHCGPLVKKVCPPLF